MKILAFCDIHGSMAALKAVKDKAKDADIILCLGDMTIFEQGLSKILSELDKIGKPVLVLPGNHEDAWRLKKVTDKSKNLYFMDGGIFETDELTILGAEGNGFSLKDKAFEELGKRFEKMMEKGKRYVLMTHAPPYDTKLDKLMEGHCGNKAIRDFILRTKPECAFSGHIHDNFGAKDKLGKTLLYNPGPKGMLIRC